jgi:hypothetical protein
VPDYAEPILAWRAWRVARAGTALRLRSAVYEETWEPRREAQARCRVGVAPHPAPALGCSCGLYGVRVPAAALRYLVGRDDPGIVHRVLGLVALWGLVAEGPSGWRATKAYPARILVPPARTNGERVDVADVALGLTEYGVPVDLLESSAPSELALELRELDDPERPRRLRAA